MLQRNFFPYDKNQVESSKIIIKHGNLMTNSDLSLFLSVIGVVVY